MDGLTGDPQGRVWAFSGNKVREWDQAAGRFIERDTPPFSGDPKKLEWGMETGFWGVNQTGLYLFAGGRWTHLQLPTEAGGSITNVAQADDGATWIAAASGRLFRLKDDLAADGHNWI